MADRKELEVKAYGKINLSLDVLGVRPDGYHSVETVMQRISLCDRVHLRWEPCTAEKVSTAGELPAAGDDATRWGIDIHLQTNRSYLPVDGRNLAYQAAACMAAEWGEAVGPGKLTISLIKRIPVAAGLAGGSSDGAAVLVGLNRLWDLHLDTRALCRTGETLGADVPFCILVQNTRYRAALGWDRGERLQPLKRPFHGYLTLAKPAFGVSTREVFAGIDRCGIAQRPDTRALIRGLRSGNMGPVYANMVNVLENYTLDRYEAVKNLKRIMETETPARKVLMSGSGPTVFALYGSLREAQRSCELLRGLRYEAYWATTD